MADPTRKVQKAELVLATLRIQVLRHLSAARLRSSVKYSPASVDGYSLLIGRRLLAGFVTGDDAEEAIGESGS